MSWDARFFIAIFPNGEWCKIHTFSGGKSLEKHCLSALEGIEGPPQDLALVGTTSRVERHAGRDERVAFHGNTITARGIEASIDARDRFHWIRVPRVLTYHSAWGMARVTQSGVTRASFGVLEHAFGAETRLDVAKLAPRRWRWDVVVVTEQNEITERFFAGLAIHGLGFHGAARVEDGAPLSRVSALRIREPDRDCDSWSGVMRTARGTLHYEARAATPVSPEVDHGGFVGFTWTGEIRGARSQRVQRIERIERVAGAGFSEFRVARA